MVFAGLFSALVETGSGPSQGPGGGASWQLDARITRDTSYTTYYFGVVSDMSTDGNHLVLSFRDNYANAMGYSLIYTRDTTTNTWSKVGQTVEHEQIGDREYEMSVSISDDGQTFVTGILDDGNKTLSDGSTYQTGFVNVWQYQKLTSSWVAKGTHGTDADPESADIFPPLTTTEGLLSGGTLLVAKQWGTTVGISGDGNTVAVSEISKRWIWLFDWNSSTSSWDHRPSVYNNNSYGQAMYDSTVTNHSNRVDGSYFQFHKNGTTIISSFNYNSSKLVIAVWNSSLSCFELKGNIISGGNLANGAQPRISYDTNTITYVPNSSSYQPAIREYNSSTNTWDVKGTNGDTILPYAATTNPYVIRHGAYPNSDGTKIVWRNKIYTYNGTSWSEESDTPNDDSTATSGLYSVFYNDNGLLLIDVLGSTNYEVLAYDYR